MKRIFGLTLAVTIAGAAFGSQARRAPRITRRDTELSM